ncbi:MAG: biotin--[acetyl-CoA-carboxylase] ligase [Zoogloeaceae bacterium]|jgi:BirA family biotin operon repressor/biotin-[acetyl-CoA-carboxylase] ligase|nr:biotin--[acetyl-CoA-carboxylase] ligase [Zoogloeaceae bacterium]
MLRTDLILARLGTDAPRFALEVVESCASTNTLLQERAANGAPSGTVLIAERQTAGRGRLGRSWFAAPEQSLAFSFLHRRHGDLAGLAGLSLAVGVAVARALEALGVTGLGLKWPNDVFLRDKKLAGILIETSADKEGVSAVIGIGLNLVAPDLPEVSAAGLADGIAVVPERAELLAALVGELGRTLAAFDAEGLAAVKDAWQARHIWQDQAVRLIENDRTVVEGICRGIDTEGALLVQTPAGISRFLAGDLSLRQA